MKGLFKKITICLLAIVALVGFVACDEETPEGPTGPTEQEIQDAKSAALEGLYLTFDAIDMASYDDDQKAVINQIKAYGELFINNSTTLEGITNNADIILDYLQTFLTSQVKLASGVYSYVAASYADRTEILGMLEKYAVDNFLTGITLFEDSGYVMYDESVEKGAEAYIPGYGFGVLAEGRLTADLAGETNAAWKRYYHTYEAEDPKTLNYGDDKGSVVGGLVGYALGSYWGTRMNDTKDGYEWYSDLATEKPVAQNASSVTGLATKYRFGIKTGDDLKYSTLTTKENLTKYNGREVVKEDYLTPWQLLFTKANGWARSTENHEGSSAIKGIAQYYNASSDGFNATAWENVGLKVGTDENGQDYMEVEFVQPCSAFYAMYYLASSMYAPVPQDFINEPGIGASNYLKFNTEAGLTPVDTTLATGPYVVERWDADQQIVFKKNTQYDDQGLYQIAGVHINILSAATQNPEAALNEFLAGKLHATGIPSTKLNEYKNDKRTSKTVGSTTTKLNVNTCTQEEWEALFGVNGSITQTSKSDYWECEPALSNSDFIYGLSYAIDRVTYAEEVGRTASVSYFGAAYMADPENGIAYNSTDAHKNAIADLIAGTDGYGYSLELARTKFAAAAKALLASGAYEPGETIQLEITWQSQSNVTVYHTAIKNFWETAFNHESVCDGQLTLEVVEYVPATWQDAYYKKMMVGKYDIGFGGVNGNPLNPLNFMEVLKSDNSSGFTLNWGPDTSVVSTDLMWADRAWSFDSLWQAAETGGYFEEGNYVPVVDAVEVTGRTENEDGTTTYVVDTNVIQGIEGVEVKFDKVVIFGYDATATYMEDEVEFVVDENGIATITVSAELTAKYNACLAIDGYMGLDLYYTSTVLEIDSSGYNTVYTSVVAPAEAE